MAGEGDSRALIPAWNKLRLVIQFADLVEVQVGGRDVVLAEPMVGGVVTRPFSMTAGSRMRFISVELTGVGFFACFGDHAADVVDAVEPVWSFLPDRSRESLVDALSHAASPTDWRAIVEGFLRGTLSRRWHQGVVHVERAVALVERAPLHGIRRCTLLCGACGRGWVGHLPSDASVLRVRGGMPTRRMAGRAVPPRRARLAGNATLHG